MGFLNSSFPQHSQIKKSSSGLMGTSLKCTTGKFIHICISFLIRNIYLGNVSLKNEEKIEVYHTET